MSNLVEHARRELTLVESDPWFIEGLVKVVQAFADMGNSGGSASVAIPMLYDLLQFKNLSPLTDDPDEWIEHPPEMWDGFHKIWQNKRNSQAFSYDGGKSYYFLLDDVSKERTYHTSEHKEKSDG